MPSERRRDFFENRDFGQELELGDRPALLIVDMMCGFTDPDYELGADLDAEVYGFSACAAPLATPTSR